MVSRCHSSSFVEGWKLWLLKEKQREYEVVPLIGFVGGDMVVSGDGGDVCDCRVNNVLKLGCYFGH